MCVVLGCKTKVGFNHGRGPPCYNWFSPIAFTLEFSVFLFGGKWRAQLLAGSPAFVRASFQCWSISFCPKYWGEQPWTDPITSPLEAEICLVAPQLKWKWFDYGALLEKITSPSPPGSMLLRVLFMDQEAQNKLDLFLQFINLVSNSLKDTRSQSIAFSWRQSNLISKTFDWQLDWLDVRKWTEQWLFVAEGHFQTLDSLPHVYRSWQRTSECCSSVTRPRLSDLQVSSIYLFSWLSAASASDSWRPFAT